MKYVLIKKTYISEFVGDWFDIKTITDLDRSIELYSDGFRLFAYIESEDHEEISVITQKLINNEL